MAEELIEHLSYFEDSDSLGEWLYETDTSDVVNMVREAGLNPRGTFRDLTERLVRFHAIYVLEQNVNWEEEDFDDEYDPSIPDAAESDSQNNNNESRDVNSANGGQNVNNENASRMSTNETQTSVANSVRLQTRILDDSSVEIQSSETENVINEPSGESTRIFENSSQVISDDSRGHSVEVATQTPRIEREIPNAHSTRRVSFGNPVEFSRVQLGSSLRHVDTSHAISRPWRVFDPPIRRLVARSSTEPSFYSSHSSQSFASDNSNSTHFLNPLNSRKLIATWKIKFSGSCAEGGSSAEEFLIAIREKRRGTDISDQEMLWAVPSLLEGVALRWYRLENHLWLNWSDFEDHFRVHFCDKNFQLRIREELHDRTQGKGEKLNDYLTWFRYIMQFLEPLPGIEEQLDLAYNNLNPEYKLRIDRNDFDSFYEFEEIGRSYEARKLSCSRYRPPFKTPGQLFPEAVFKSEVGDTRRRGANERFYSKNNSRDRVCAAVESNEIESEKKEESMKNSNRSRVFKNSSRARSFVPKNSNRGKIIQAENDESSEEQNDDQAAVEAAEPRPGNSSGFPPVEYLCWNCRKVGHPYKKCTAKKTIFCYDCGKPDVTRNKCSCRDLNKKDKSKNE